MSKTILFSAVLAISVLTLSGAVDAHPRGGHYIGRYHSHPSFGFYFGAPLYTRPYYYPYFPYYPYYSPQIYTVPVEPPVYIERGVPAQPLPSGYWYYCSDPEGYYPYVKECPSGWLQVNPAPPPSR